MTTTFFADARQNLLDKGAQLQDILSEEEYRQVDEQILRKLRENCFEIAVVGQIKAGKSTFLNALMEMPDLLPRDVNPCSAVITRLHFGRPGDPVCGGDFTFYSADEWEEIQILAGWNQGKLKKWVKWWTDDAKLKKDLEDKVRRAQKGLGTELDSLFGTRRRVEQLDRPLLNSYLAVGGKYVDITKQGDLYFSRPLFSEHCTIVDTPGLNDPLPFREALTMNYLGEAHAFVYLLSAAASFTRTDLEALKELVQGLKKERLLIFINRVDALEDPKTQLELVYNLVELGVRAHFPDQEIPILVGCAHWAQLACQACIGNIRPLKKLLGDYKICEYGIERKYFTAEDIETWQGDAIKHLDAAKTAFMKASGIPQLREALAEKLLGEKGAALLETTRTNLVVFAEKAAESLLDAAKEEDDTASKLELGLISMEGEIDRLNKTISQLKQQRDEIRKSEEEACNNFKQTAEEGLENLVEKLGGEFQDFVRGEVNKLRSQVPSIFGPRFHEVGLYDLRNALIRIFQSEYGKARTELVEEGKRRLWVLQNQLAVISPELGAAIEVVPPLDVNPTPSMGAVKQKIAVDLGNFLKRFLAFSPSEEAERELWKEFSNSFGPPIEGLLGSAAGALEGAIEEMKRNVKQSIANAVSKLENDQKASLEKCQELSRDKDPQKEKAFIAEKRGWAVHRREGARKLQQFKEDLATSTLARPDPGQNK